MSQNLKNVKKSAPFVLATLAGSFVFASAYSYLFNKSYFGGHNNKGGNILKIKSKYDESGLAYNREF